MIPSRYMAIPLDAENKALKERVAELENIIKQIRAEIEDLDRFYDNDYLSGNRDSMFKCNEVMEIIDKYKAESEVIA